MSVPPCVLSENSKSPTREEFEVYRGSQARMVKSQFVLNAALRTPGIASSSLLRDAVDKIAFLEENLEVTFPATEFLRISFKGVRTPESVQLVNAVVTEYLSEVANSEFNKRNRRISELEKAHQDLEEQIRTRKNTLKRLLKNLQPADPPPLTEKQKMMAELHEALRKERARIYFELLSAHARLAMHEEDLVLAANDGAPAPDLPAEYADKIVAHRTEIKDTIRFSEMMLKQIDEELDKHLVEISHGNGWQFDTEAMKADLARIEKLDNQIVDEIDRLKIELRAEPRIVRYRDATIEVEN